MGDFKGKAKIKDRGDRILVHLVQCCGGLFIGRLVQALVTTKQQANKQIKMYQRNKYKKTTNTAETPLPPI